MRAYSIARSNSATKAENHRLIDIAGHAHQAYGITSDALILVRPDGYIGLTGTNMGQEPIIDYLHALIGR